MEYNVKRFWKLDSLTEPTEYSTMFERLYETREQSKVNIYMSNPRQRALAGSGNLSFFDILMGKKISSQDRVITQHQRLEEDIDNLTNGMMNENLSDDVNQVVEQLNNEAKIKFLQMYFDSYMAPMQSDANWRLGPVTGTVLETDLTDKSLGIIERGEIYTRSNFALPFYRQLWSGGDAIDKREFYTSLFFPPYKVGHATSIGESTSYMRDILKVNPEATFNQDTFRLKKEGYTYREAGFKSINDYISFLQWIAEGMTGVVSTYLTEWDLSIYMQEHLLTPMVNGGPTKLFLNYRVRDDNPMATEDGKYTDDRALVYNVAGSAVSKIDFDCQKLWRPSDYPLSQWWSSYKINRDWRMSIYSRHDEEYDFDMPYMDVYDNIKSEFPYEAKPMKEIFKQQDFLGAMLGTWPNMNMKYSHAFYYTDMDSMTDFEIKVQGWLKKVSGADPGYSTKKKKAMNNFLEKAKEEMLLNGGYYGSPTPPGLSGGYMGRMMMQSAMSGSDDKMTGGKMAKAANSGAKDALDNEELNQLNNANDIAHDELNSGLSNKADASNMCKFTGINRFSPPLFGGPHGADYNPNTIQAYFDENNLFLRNVPRVSPNNSSYFTSEDDSDYFTDVNKFYFDGIRGGTSPNKAMKKLVKGLQNYTVSWANYRALKTSWIDGTIEYDFKTKLFNKYIMPTRSPQGEVYNYKGEYRFTSKILIRQSNPWGQRDWWYNYGSYYNTYNISWYTRRGWIYTYYTISYIVQRLASYYFTGVNPFKQYKFDDMANHKWKIMQHKFESLNTDMNGFWSWVSAFRGKAYLKERYPDKFRVRTAFVLKFDNPSGEDYFRNVVMAGRSSAPVFFFQGNKNGGRPDSIFRASVSSGQYQNIIETKITINMLLFKFTITIPSYFYTKYLSVDLINSDYFEDNLSAESYSNRYASGVDVPMHLKTTQNTQSVYGHHVLTKFINVANDTTPDLVIATKTEKKTSVNGLAALAGLLTGSLILMIAAVIYTLLTQKKSTDSAARWVSPSTMGISGRGIVQNIPGLDPGTYDPPGVSAGAAYLKMPAFAKDVPIKNLPIKFNYNSQEADADLKFCLANIFTRTTFMSEQNPELPGQYVSLDTPIRNFLSICMTQVSYIKFAQQTLIDSIDFEVLHQALLNCVDKCVIKANGLTKDDIKIDIDREHILYNYWVEQAILFFGDKTTYNQTKEQLKSEFNRKITKFDYVINALTPICKKHIHDWTFNQICFCYDLIWSMKEEAEKGLIDRFIFAYLNVLYNYRFYFVARRFNKENGTMWIMRALESVLDFVVPFAEDMPPPPLSKLKNKTPSYKVVFYEISNSTSLKRQAITDDLILDPDRVSVVYTKVDWVHKKEYDKWMNYQANTNELSEVPEIVEIIHNGIVKYATKPINGLYQLMSAELTENDKNKKWNQTHEQEPQRILDDIDEAVWNITWGDSPDQTPIKWNVFGNVNIDNLLEYSKASVSPQDLICLMEEGADFWTVRIPQSLWPRKTGYKTKIKLKAYKEKGEVTNIKNDVMITMLGPMAYTIYPITAKQERPVPGVAAEVPDIYKTMSQGTDGFKKA